MPIVDMPLSQLKEYQGRNPRPADMEEYLANAFSESRQRADSGMRHQPPRHRTLLHFLF